MQGIVLKMEPGAEYLVLRDRNVIQIWQSPGTSFCTRNEGNVNREGRYWGGGEGDGGAGRERLTSVNCPTFLVSYP